MINKIKRKIGQVIWQAEHIEITGVFNKTPWRFLKTKGEK